MNAKSSATLSKVPEVNLGFWAIKILAATLGEVSGNAVTLTLGFGYLAGTAIFGCILVVLLVAQLRSDRFHPLLYWAVLTATTLAGATLADFCDCSLGIGYFEGSLILPGSVLSTLVLWKRTLGTVAVETVRAPKVGGLEVARGNCTAGLSGISA